MLLYQQNTWEINYGNSRIVKTPIGENIYLSKNEGKCVSQLKYSRMIWSPIYLMSCTRSDIGYVVSKLSRYTSILGFDH